MPTPTPSASHTETPLSLGPQATGEAQARGILTPTFVAGGCQVCNTGVLRFGDDVRESLEKLSLEGGDVLKAALMAAEMFCAAAKEEYTTWEAAFEGV